MPSEEFSAELELAVAAIPSKEEEVDDSATAETDDDVGAGTVDGEDGTTPDATGDGNGAPASEEGSAGSGDPSSDEPSAASKLEQPALSDAVLTEAVRHGIPLEDARLFPTEAALNRVIQAVRKSIADNLPKEEAKEEEDPFASLPTLDPESYDEDTIKAWNALIGITKQQQAEIKELKAKQQAVYEETTRSSESAAINEISTWFDTRVGKLGDDYKDVVGSGSTDALGPNSPQYAKRTAILDHAVMLIQGSKVQGNLLDRDTAFDMAVKAVLADDIVKAKEAKMKAKLDKRSKMHIQRGGGQQGRKSADSPLAAVIADIKEKLGEK